MAVVPETEARASCTLCKPSNSELRPQSSLSFVVTLSSPKDSKLKSGTIRGYGGWLS